MKLKARFWIALFIMGIFSSVVLPSVNAEIFDIGERMESDLINDTNNTYYPFTSGAIVLCNYDDINYTTLIFDGNVSTGIEINNTGWYLRFQVYFPIPLYVNNITAKPHYINGSSEYSILVTIVDMIDSSFLSYYHATSEIVIQMNCFVDSIYIRIYPNGTDQFYFNDVIINYTPIFTDVEELQNQIDNLTSEMEDLQSEIKKLAEQEKQDDNEDDSKLDDLFLEPPFIGPLWVVVIVALISSLRGRIASKKEKSEVKIQTTEEKLTLKESD